MIRKAAEFVVIALLTYIPSELVLLFLQHKTGLWLAVVIAYAISLIQFAGECWMVERAGAVVEGWWKVSQTRQRLQWLLSDLRVPQLEEYVLLFIFSFVWRLGGVIIWRTARLRGGRTILITDTLIRLLAVAGILQLLWRWI